MFLDEVGDIPLELQPKLLRVLQEQEFERLGSTKTIRVHVRLVAATNRDLPRMVRDGQFRSDLYYRLNVFPILLPPLRERPEDIPRLVRHFTKRFARRMGRQIGTIPADAMAALVRYAWPGNVRELENIIERAVSVQEMEKSGKSFDVPLLSNQLHGGRTPILPQTQLREMGFSVAIYPSTGLFAAAHAMARVYASLTADKPVDVPLYAFSDFDQLIGFQKIWDFEKKFADLLAETGRAANR